MGLIAHFLQNQFPYLLETQAEENVESFTEVYGTEDWKIYHGMYRGIAMVAPRDLVMFAIKLDMGEEG
jgi:hypothetical protein